MKRIAIVATLALLAACAKGDKTNATDTTTAGGSVAPAATDSSSSKMSSGYSDSLRKSDSAHMATGTNPSSMDTTKKSPTP